jgi:hypothetical protein
VRCSQRSGVLPAATAPVRCCVCLPRRHATQSDVEFELLVRKFASFYCKYELAASSDTVLAEFDGPRLSLEVKPASCPIYTDEDSGRNYVSFQDCSAATLVIKTTPREEQGGVVCRAWGSRAAGAHNAAVMTCVPSRATSCLGRS